MEARGEHGRVRHIEGGQDVGPGARIGGGRQRDPRHAGKALRQLRQAAVLGAELVPPGADAMRFVDREQGHLPPLQPLERARHQQPLRRHVQQVEPSSVEQPGDLARHGRLDLAVQRASGNAELPQGCDLIVHQGDQRRHDDGRPRQADCRHLVA